MDHDRASVNNNGRESRHMRHRRDIQEVMVIGLRKIAPARFLRRIALARFVVRFVMTEVRSGHGLFVHAGARCCSPDGLKRQHQHQHSEQQTAHCFQFTNAT